jgi:tetratricopeptide (TPR) repeat protein
VQLRRYLTSALYTHSVVILFALGSFEAKSFAAGPKNAEPSEAEREAQLSMQRGIALFGRGDAEGALREYESAKILAPAANIPYLYAAEAQTKLGHPALAIENLETYLAKNPQVSDADEARARIKALRAELPGSLRVVIFPPSAKVDAVVDRSVRLENERLLMLKPGVHSLSVRAAGFERYEQDVTIEASKAHELVISLTTLIQDSAPRLVPETPARVSKPSSSSGWLWTGGTLLGAGAVGFAGSILVDAEALRKSFDRLDDATNRGDPQLASFQSDTRSLRTGLQVAYVASAVIALSGLAVILLRPSSTSPPRAKAAWGSAASGFPF